MTLEALEKKIQQLLLDFENERGDRIGLVTVDTRNYANCTVEIFMQQNHE